MNYLINNLQKFSILGFDAEDREELQSLMSRSDLMLMCNRETGTVSVTPTDVDYHMYVIRGERVEEIIQGVFSDIEALENSGDIILTD